MNLPFRRRRRFTNPPEVIPLVVIAIVAMFVAQLAIGALGALGVAAFTLLPGGEPFPTAPAALAAGAAAVALELVLMVLGWRVVRRLVAAWFRRQQPEPLGPPAR